MKEQTVMKEYLDLQTCSEPRIRKIKVTLENCRKIIGKDLTKLQLTDITKLLRTINNSDYKLWTKNDYKKIFKNFLKHYYKKEFLEWTENKQFQEGFKTVNKRKAFNKDKINKNTLMKPEELEKILRVSNSMKQKALFTLMYESAFRPCEITKLRWKDLNFNDSNNICSVKITSPKTKETREVPVRDCIVHLKRWREDFQYPKRTENDFVFPSQKDRNKHLAENSITVILTRLCKEAGIRHLFPYMFRHTRIYEIQKRLGSRIASKFAGHSLETSEIYNHLDSDDVEEAMLEKVFTTKEIPKDVRDKVIEGIKYLTKRVKGVEEQLNVFLGDNKHKKVEVVVGNKTWVWKKEKIK